MIDTLAPGFIRRASWAANRLAVEREVRLRALVRLAIDRSPWHRERLAAVDPDRLTESDLPRLPTMTKRDVVRHSDAIRTGVGAHELHTSGSSGERAVFIYSDTGLATWALSFMRFALRDRAVSGITVTLGAADDTHASSACARIVPGGVVLDMHRPLAETIARLEELQPARLIAYASLLERLASAQGLRIAPQCIVSTSEPLEPTARRTIERAWGVPVLDVYATTEGLIAASCGHGALHVNDDVCILEIERGKAYLTNLYSDAQPLIRYELGDQLAWADDRPCLCGSGMRRLAPTIVRAEEQFRYGGDIVVHPQAFREVLLREPRITGYQVHQTPVGARVTITVCDAIARERLHVELIAMLAKAGVRDPQVTVAVVDEIGREGAGKVRRFVPQGGAR